MQEKTAAPVKKGAAVFLYLFCINFLLRPINNETKNGLAENQPIRKNIYAVYISLLLQGIELLWLQNSALVAACDKTCISCQIAACNRRFSGFPRSPSFRKLLIAYLKVDTV